MPSSIHLHHTVIQTKGAPIKQPGDGFILQVEWARLQIEKEAKEVQ